MQSKGKMWIGYYQIATRVSDVYEVPMPDAVATLLSFFEVFNINIDGFGLPLQCAGLGSYHQQLAATMALSAAISAMLVIGFAARGCCRRSEGLVAGLLAALPWLLFLSFLSFPLVSSASGSRLEQTGSMCCPAN